MSGQLSRSTSLVAVVDTPRTLNTVYASNDLELSERIFRESPSCTHSSAVLQTRRAHHDYASVVARKKLLFIIISQCVTLKMCYSAYYSINTTSL